MKIRWTPESIQHLEDIQDYVAEDDPLAAFELVNRIIDLVESTLATHPKMDRSGDDLPGTRELVIVYEGCVRVEMLNRHRRSVGAWISMPYLGPRSRSRGALSVVRVARDSTRGMALKS